MCNIHSQAHFLAQFESPPLPFLLFLLLVLSQPLQTWKRETRRRRRNFLSSLANRGAKKSDFIYSSPWFPSQEKLSGDCDPANPQLDNKTLPSSNSSNLQMAFPFFHLAPKPHGLFIQRATVYYRYISHPSILTFVRLFPRARSFTHLFARLEERLN